MKQDIFEEMLYSEYAKMTSQAGGIGLSDRVYDFLNR
jgi:Rod binding domain-containing protein